MSSDEEIRILLRDQSRDWLRRIIDSSGITANAIAKKAGVSTANLNKLLNQPDFPHPMSETVKIKISRAMGVPLPGGDRTYPAIREGSARGSALAEKEIVPYRPERPSASEIPAQNGLDWWLIQTSLLDLEGFLPGDRVLVDLNRQAKAGDIVVAQISADGGRAVTTVFRKFEPPMLTCHCTARNYPRPEYVDADRIIIMGVVIEQRRRLVSDAA